MKLVLTHDVPSLGKTHDVVDVKSGYGRNFLLPRGFAMFLTPGMAKMLEAERIREAAKHAKMAAQSSELARTIEGLVLQFRRTAAKGGKLYGSINKVAIAKALKSEHSIEVPTAAVKLAAPIRETGTVKVKIHLGEGLEPTLTIRVAAEK